MILRYIYDRNKFICNFRTTIICVLVFILVIFVVQKKGYELLEEKIKNNKILNDADSESREKEYRTD